MSSVPEFNFEMSATSDMAPTVKKTILKYTHDTEELYLVLLEISNDITSIEIYMPWGPLNSMPSFDVDANYTLVSGSALEAPSSGFELQIKPKLSPETFTIHINAPQSYWTKIYTYLFTQDSMDQDVYDAYAAVVNSYNPFSASSYLAQQAQQAQQAEEDEDQSKTSGGESKSDRYSVVLRF